MKSLRLIFAILIIGAMPGRTVAEVLRWDWTADESQVKNSTANPPGDGSTDSPATGFGFVRYDTDTNMMTVSYHWNDLFGELTKLHIHGPATPDMSNPQHVIETFGPPDVPASVDLHNGSWTETFELQTLVQTGFPDLSPTEIVDIMRDGLSYVNVHSSVFGTGEIRGNLGLPTIVPEPGAAAILLSMIALLIPFRGARPSNARPSRSSTSSPC